MVVRPSPLRLLMVSTSYPADLADWRGVFMRHLADALARRDDLRLSLWAPPGETHPAIRAAATAAESAWLRALMQAGGIAHLLRSGGARRVTAPLALVRKLRRVYRRAAPDTDLYHVNWLQNALPLPAHGKPALIAVLGTDMQLLRLPLMRGLLRRVCRHRRVIICPNASWMMTPLTAAFGDLAQIRMVPFGIDPHWYALERRFQHGDAARWLVVSRLTRDKIGPLFEWCEPHFRNTARQLHLFGPMQETLSLPGWVHYHGPATPDQLQNEWFPSAQGLITLSRHAEGRPQVMLEAMAAGLPIIASRLPAHEDLLLHQRTGWLCESPAALGPALATLEDAATNQRIGAAARTWVREAIGTWDDCAARYSALYRQLTGTDSE